ncbi:MAG: SRPBCC domain-containing protein [Flavobacteriales bacterium]|nr:SRPBCC domain-containing protein [Flavobacteriales bacterium]MBL6873818.1 SRPBCC domain-containing protein [Flavobacteriales bacterium]
MLYELEYPIHSSIKILYERLSTLSGLSEWFADDVNVSRDGIYTFTWEGSSQDAVLISKKKGEHIRFRWLDSEEDEYFEFRIQIDELTSDVSLIVSDFADDEDDKEDATNLWDTQIDNLKHLIGS